MTTRPWLIALGVLLALVRPAWAQVPDVPPAKVLLIGAADEAAVLRMRDELRLIGLRVQVLDSKEPVEVASLARRLDADAVAEVESWPPEIRLWVQGTEGDPSTLAVSDSLTEGEPEILALRAVELIRARLLPVPPGAEAPPTPLPSPEPPAPSKTSSPTPTPRLPEAPAPAPEVQSPPATAPSGGFFEEGEDAPDEARAGSARPLGLFLGPALGVQPAGPSPALQVALGVQYRVLPRLSVAVRGLIPTHGASLDAAAGEATVRTLALGGAGRVVVTDPEAPFTLVASGGLGAAALFYRGEPRGPGRSLDGTSWSFSPFAALAGRYAISDVWVFRLEAEASLLLPRQVVRIAEEEAGSVGFPAVTIAAGVEVWP